MTYPVASNADTGVEFKDLKLALSTISNVPDGFTLHQATSRAVSRRIELFEKLDDPNQFDLLQVDWATAELLSLCTLANEGRFCRLSGQDSQRGTFGQRHAVWHDAVTGDTHHALPPSVQVVNSPLSELGVLGFEHGFSLASPNFLVLWEAQFADFVDNSQVLIDTMISSEKDKFALESNLVLLLPHGYDGMGPEHSSARLERFLTLHTDTPDAEERAHNDLERLQASNFLVTYPTSPSNYFHLLRRSFTWPFRRPMVVLTPKRTLRLTKATSSVSEFLKDTTTLKAFSPVLDDRRHTKNDSSNVKSIVVCSGELFYDIMKLLEAMPEDDSHNVAVFRLEQLAPFPFRELKTAFDAYPNAQRVVWVQEEPGNMGALRFVAPFLARALPESIVLSNPIARPVSAAPATGNPVDHQKSHQNILLSIKDWIQKPSD
jgi:2-oxoglutarate dehydrogenase E1 component